MAQITLTPNGPGTAPLTITSAMDPTGAATGYVLIESGTDFGNSAWTHQYGGQRGTQGALPAQGVPANRTVTLAIRCGAATEAAHLQLLSTLMRTVDLMRTRGGVITWQRPAQTAPSRQYFTVLTATAAQSDLATSRSQQRFRTVVVVTAICAPYLLGDPMDFTDDFSVDTVTPVANGGAYGYWTFDAGATTDVVAAGALLAAANLTTEKRLIHTGYGYTYGDHGATVKITPGATITGFKAGVALKRLDAQNYIAAYVDDNGTNSRVRIDTVIGGVTTNVASLNLAARLTAGSYWLWAHIEGATVFARFYAAPPLLATAGGGLGAVQSTLTGQAAALFGPAREGRAGLVWVPQSATATLDDFQVAPFTYWYVNGNENTGWLDVPAYGAIPGDAPALARVKMTTATSSSDVHHLLVAWSARPLPHNLMANGGFEWGTTAGWSVTAVTGVVGAATSITWQSGNAKYGTGQAAIATPATSNVGAHYRIYRKMIGGLPYVAIAWIWSASSTTSCQIGLGVNGDIAYSTPAALTTTPTLRTVVWNVNGDKCPADLVVQQTTATASTINVDGCMVVPGMPGVLNAALTAGATTASLTAIPDEWPDVFPFPVLVKPSTGATDGEIALVTGISGTTVTLLRGQEGTTGVAANQYDGLYALPTLRAHFEGHGGNPPIAVVGAGADHQTTVVADSGSALGLTGSTTGGTNVTSTGGAVITPALIPADDYGGQSITVETWTRVIVSGSNGAQSWVTSAYPVTPAGAFGGAGIQYGMEFGATAINLTLPASGSNDKARFVKTGTIALASTAGPAAAWDVRQAIANASGSNSTGLDYVAYVPARARISSVTGKPSSAVAAVLPAVSSEETLTIASDGSASLAVYPSTDGTPVPSLGGALPEVGPGSVNLLARVSNLVPGDPTTGTTVVETATYPFTFRLGVTPRYTLARAV